MRILFTIQIQLTSIFLNFSNCFMYRNINDNFNIKTTAGLNKKYKTKQEVMRNNAQTRIRSYYNSVCLHTQVSFQEQCPDQDTQLL